jgi:FkbM family methyltransferase
MRFIQYELLRGSIRLLRNWREMFLYGVLLRKLGVRVRPTAVLRFRSGLEIEMVSGGYGGYTILFQDIFIRRDYQPTPEFVVRDGWTVLDIGANMGFFTCQAASSAKDVRVVAVEPMGPYIEVLRANIKRNHFQQVTVIQAAAAPRSGSKIPLTVWYTKFGELKVGTRLGNGRQSTEIVTGLSMADIFEKGQIQVCNLLKMDIEGAEYELFEATASHIWERIDRVVMETHELHGRHASELVQLLMQYGFSVATRGSLLWATRTLAV